MITSRPVSSESTGDGLTARFREMFGASPRIFRASGRVNLIGEHTDYNDGFVARRRSGELPGTGSIGRSGFVQAWRLLRSDDGRRFRRIYRQFVRADACATF